MKIEGNDADGSINFVNTCRDLAHVCEGHAEANGAVNAHVQGADIIEKNHTTEAIGLARWEE